MTFSPLEILQAGDNTRNRTNTDLELFMEVEDALTPKCEHSEHNTRTHQHGGEVHRLMSCSHSCATGIEKYICDEFWATVNSGLVCLQCHELLSPSEYIVLAVF